MLVLEQYHRWRKNREVGLFDQRRATEHQSRVPTRADGWEQRSFHQPAVAGMALFVAGDTPRLVDKTVLKHDTLDKPVREQCAATLGAPGGLSGIDDGLE